MNRKAPVPYKENPFNSGLAAIKEAADTFDNTLQQLCSQCVIWHKAGGADAEKKIFEAEQLIQKISKEAALALNGLKTVYQLLKPEETDVWEGYAAEEEKIWQALASLGTDPQGDKDLYVSIPETKILYEFSIAGKSLLTSLKNLNQAMEDPYSKAEIWKVQTPKGSSSEHNDEALNSSILEDEQPSEPFKRKPSDVGKPKKSS